MARSPSRSPTSARTIRGAVISPARRWQTNSAKAQRFTSPTRESRRQHDRSTRSRVVSSAAEDRGLVVSRVDYNENSADIAQAANRRCIASQSRYCRHVRHQYLRRAWRRHCHPETPVCKARSKSRSLTLAKKISASLRDGIVSLVIAQKPADMGYLGVALVTAYLDGVGSIPARIGTGYAIITADNIDDPDVDTLHSIPAIRAMPRPRLMTATTWLSYPASIPIPSISRCHAGSMQGSRTPTVSTSSNRIPNALT